MKILKVDVDVYAKSSVVISNSKHWNVFIIANNVIKQCKFEHCSINDVEKLACKSGQTLLRKFPFRTESAKK
jgi:hypothetical protein